MDFNLYSKTSLQTYQLIFSTIIYVIQGEITVNECNSFYDADC